MNSELHRGNVLLLKRPLADFICVVEVVEGDGVVIRYIDTPPDEKGVKVALGDVIKLAEAQERELPTAFVVAIERQRQVVFAPKRQPRGQSLGASLKGVGDDVYAQILQILADDNVEVAPKGEREGEGEDGTTPS